MLDSDFVAGVDGCKGGWVWLEVYDSGRTEVELVSVVDVLRDRPQGLQALAIDIPIGLLDRPSACDVAARTLLGSARRSSVFRPPCRAALAGVDYAEMCVINRGITGVSLSKQSCAIAAKIKEVDDVITPAHQTWSFEVHPEICFWHFVGRPMGHKKKSRAGREERLKVLALHLPQIAEHVATRAAGIGADDLLDAAVAALTARRWVRGEAVRVCDPESDQKWLRVEIVY